jgi:hypothetical protein
MMKMIQKLNLELGIVKLAETGNVVKAVINVSENPSEW